MDDYQLVWADEFNKNGPLNSNDWVFEQGFVRNGEMQWYQPDNARCSGGKLIIEARQESKANPGYVPDSKYWPSNVKAAAYTSACAKTVGKHSWLYGRFEMRAKIDTRPGSWPAFWMMGDHGGWPACGEVDVMEYYRDVLRANVAWAQLGGSNGSAWNSAQKPISEFAADWPSEFHTWRMDWDANFIKLYCDDQLLNTQDLSKTINPDGTNPFHSSMYMLLNQAIGGTCGGDPSHTAFPVKFEIDYVRVYQRPSQIAGQRAAATHVVSDFR
jgi:beta-glucanase (GH16 family)